ncbi:MAG TPA: hypothetical protein VE974_16970 [Thermoanaerobaculia bacterium]|nr:hypothetical protein [Thermoanaerobaculia bacterium]
MNLTWLYVGVLYGVCVWLLRRANVALPRRVAALFFVLVLLFLWRPLTQDVTIIPADVIKLTPPWSEIRAPGRPPVDKYQVSNLNLHDLTMQVIPWTHQVRESWRRFEVPLWNDSAGSGYPLLANGQSTPLSPFHLVTLPLALNHAQTAEAAMRLLVALVLTFLFCRTRYSLFASVVAAVVYAFSTWMTTWLQFPIASASAFLPGVLLAIEKLLDGVTRRRFIIATLIFAATVLSGHPETVFHVGLIAAPFGLWVALIEKRVFKPLLSVAAASIVAALIASPFLVPFAEAVLRSQRFAEVRATRDITPPFSDFFSAVLLLQPRFFGHLPIERPWGPTTLESICGFAGVLAIASTIAAAIFIIRGRRFRQRETLYVLGAICSLAIILGWPYITPLFHAFAGLAPPMRMRLGICWFGAILVGAVIDWTRRDTRVPLLLGTLAVSATMFWFLRTVPFPSPSHRITAILSLLPSVAVLFALTIPRVHFQAAALLTVVELWAAIAHWHPVLPSRELYPRTGVVASLQSLQAQSSAPFRILGTGGQVYPNIAAMAGLEDVRVHDPMADNRYVTLLAQVVDWNPGDYYAKWNDTASPLLDFLNVKYVVADRELTDSRFDGPIYDGPGGRIYENRNVLPRFYAVRNVLLGGGLREHADYRYTAIVDRLPRRFQSELTAPWTTADAAVAIERHSVDRYTLRIFAPRTTLIVSSIPNWPGWRVPFPVVDVNGPFLGFIVPEGTHVVKVAYRPLSFYLPAAISLLTLATLLALSRTRRARRRP